MTRAQARFLATAKQFGADRDGAPYWDVVNDWVKGDRDGQLFALGFRNSCRTVDALIRDGHIYVDDDGLIRLGRKP